MNRVFNSICKNKNAGFSLVELIIAVAIASIVGTAVFGFMTVGAKTFRFTSSDVNMQNEAQLTFSQIQDLLIDAVVGVDYVYIKSGESFTDVSVDESNKVVRDSEIPAGVIGKKLIIYNTTESGRNIYEIIWKEADSKVYYKEYAVSYDGASGKVLKGSLLNSGDGADGALMAEYVTGFAADVSQVETKRVVRLDLTFEKDNRSYSSSHNITLRNKIVSGNKVPDYLVSENIVPVSNRIIGRDLYFEPGDRKNIKNLFSVEDTNGNVVTGKTLYFELVNAPSLGVLGTGISNSGDLVVSPSQIDPFDVKVTTGDGVQDTFTINIIRITGFDPITWAHIGSIGEGELTGMGTSPTADDLIEGEEFELTVPTPPTGNENIDKTSENRNTIEDTVVFIKTKGANLFTIVSQDGHKCKCKMNPSLSSSEGDGNSWVDGTNGSQSYSQTDIEVTAVSVYSMGGRSFNASSMSDKDIDLTEYDYRQETTSPVSLGAGFSADNRYYENGIVAPVKVQWTGKAYVTTGSFNIDIDDNDMERGFHYPKSITYQGNTGEKIDNISKLTRLNDDTSIDWTKHIAVIDISFTEEEYKQDGTVAKSVTTKHNTGSTYLDGEGSHVGILVPEDTNPNSVLRYDFTAYIIELTNANKNRINLNAGNTYVYGNNTGGLTEDDLKNAKHRSNTYPLIFDRLRIAYSKNLTSDTNVYIDTVNNNVAAIYPRKFGQIYDGSVGTSTDTTIKFTWSKQFNTARNCFMQKWDYYQEKNGWVFYEDDGRLYSTGSNGPINVDARGDIVNDEGRGTLTFKYLPSKINTDTPQHLRLVPRYESGDMKKVLFDYPIDVWIWNIKIPLDKLPGVKNDKKNGYEVSYFPVPTDKLFKSEFEKNKKLNDEWNGAFLKQFNFDNIPTIRYNLQKIGVGNEAGYDLTLSYLGTDGNYTNFASYHCEYDGHEWKALGGATE